MDNNFFIVRVFQQTIIEIYFYNNNNLLKVDQCYPICFVFYLGDFSQITYLLSLCDEIFHCSTIHKFYLGKEIFKAQISIQLNQCYIQD
uniref:DUF4346 domain-containing protein n=1 Tax=Leptosiphonia brodiei TaxID=2608611 RepID=A0A1Z1M9T1_9FLOR|nr:hypothetical protein [Leptosiphonia brodiei]ARW62867.1 hypothetical protein [Leptosiphonia brodiei]